MESRCSRMLNKQRQRSWKVERTRTWFRRPESDPCTHHLMCCATVDNRFVNFSLNFFFNPQTRFVYNVWRHRYVIRFFLIDWRLPCYHDVHFSVFSGLTSSCRNNSFNSIGWYWGLNASIPIKWLIMMPGILGVEQILLKMFCLSHYPKQLKNRLPPPPFKNFHPKSQLLKICTINI